MASHHQLQLQLQSHRGGHALIEDLTEHATQRRFVYSHPWEPNDLVMRDDRWAMHCAMPYSSDDARVLRWSGVLALAQV